MPPPIAADRVEGIAPPVDVENALQPDRRPLWGVLVAFGIPLVAVATVVGAAIVVNHFYPSDLNAPLHQPLVWGLLVAWFGFWLALGLYRLVVGRKGRAGGEPATPVGEADEGFIDFFAMSEGRGPWYRTPADERTVR
jgi:hypothetical protein